MAPDNKGQRRKQQQLKAEFVADEKPGLEHPHHAQDNAADDHPLDAGEGRGVDAVAVAAGDAADEVNKEAEDDEK